MNVKWKAPSPEVCMDFLFYSHLAIVLALSFALARYGSAWVERLYGKFPDILTFPDKIRERGRYRPYLLGILFLLCGVRYVFMASGIPLLFMLYLSALLLLMTMTDFEQYCLFDEMMIPLALGGMALTAYVPSAFFDHVLASLAGGVLFLIIAILSRGALGGGDVKLIACLGLWFGTDSLLFICMTGIILGGLSALVMLVLKIKKRKSSFAYGPYFALTALALILLRGL